MENQYTSKYRLWNSRCINSRLTCLFQRSAVETPSETGDSVHLAGVVRSGRADGRRPAGVHAAGRARRAHDDHAAHPRAHERAHDLPRAPEQL